MAIIVRRANLSDADAIYRLVEQFAASFQPDKETFLASMSRLVSAEAVCLRVAEEGSALIGYVLGFDHDTFYANGRVAWMEELMVEQSRRKQGIGRAMVRHFEEWAQARNARLIALATRRAAPFYAALDYQESAAYFRKVLKDPDPLA